ncbi:hypothetical protein ACKWTF_015276 [Chironomus riparius]
MQNLKNFTSVLYPLRFFGLQYFSINSINQFAVNQGTFETKFIILFIIALPTYSIISSYYYIFAFINFEDVASSHNVLQYEFKIVVYTGRFLIIVVSIFEAFLKTKKAKKIWTKSWKVSKLLSHEFGINLKGHYWKLHAVMKRRMMLIFIGLLIVEVVPQISPNFTLHTAVMIVTKLTGSIIISLVIFKHCFYVDFINLHISIITDIIKTKKLNKIHILRQCYTELIKMERQLNESVSLQLPITVSIIIMCLIRRAYRFYALFTGQLHVSAFIYTIMNNTSEELAYIYALCFCCDRTEIVVSFYRRGDAFGL